MSKKMLLVFGLAMVVSAGLGYAAGHKNHGTILSHDAIEWKELAPGSPLQLAVLWGDPATGDHTRLIKLPAGFEAPIHAHTADYHGINLTGTWRHGFEETGESAELPPDSYVFQPGGEMHSDACVGPEDCILFLNQHGPADFIPKEKQ